jgi:hypothetical protein
MSRAMQPTQVPSSSRMSDVVNHSSKRATRSLYLSSYS